MTRKYLIDTAGLVEMGDDVTLLDCRFSLLESDAGRSAYTQGHIPGAVYVDLDADLAAPVSSSTGRHPLPPAEVLAKRFAGFGVSSAQTVIVYDANNGAFAARAWWCLRWLGHTDVRLLDGGFAAWQAARLPISTAVPALGAGDFVAAPRNEWLLTTDDIVAQLDSIGDLRLFDARDAERFAGRTEPIDPVAGHIPGAKNLPLGSSLAEDGRWKSSALLRDMWKSALGPDFGVDWSVMCGSGVTACHLALSAAEAGYRMPRVYVGSWSEWIRDPKRPVATGDGAGAGRDAELT